MVEEEKNDHQQSVVAADKSNTFGSQFVLYLLVVVCPPLAIFLKGFRDGMEGFENIYLVHFVVNVVVCIIFLEFSIPLLDSFSLAPIPAILHALFVPQNGHRSSGVESTTESIESPLVAEASVLEANSASH